MSEITHGPKNPAMIMATMKAIITPSERFAIIAPTPNARRHSQLFKMNHAGTGLVYVWLSRRHSGLRRFRSGDANHRVAANEFGKFVLTEPLRALWALRHDDVAKVGR